MDPSALKLKLPLIKKFLILTSVSFFAVWFILSSITSLEIQLFTLSRTEDQTKKLIENYIETEVAESAFSKTNNNGLNKQQFDAFFKQGNVLDIELVKVYNKEKNIIYSNKEELIGTKASGSDAINVEKTLNGEDPIFERESSSKEASRDKGVKNSFEIHFPIKYGGSEPVGVLEAYVSRVPIYKSLAPFLYTIWLTVGLVFGFLFFVLRKIFKNASDTIISQNVSLSEKTRVLDKRNEEKESILNSIGEILVVLDKENRIVIMNKKALDFSGLKTEEIIAKPFNKIIKLKGLDGFDPIKKSFKTKEIIRVSYKDGLLVQDKSGKDIPATLTVAPIILGKKQIIGSVITIFDAKAEKELDKVKDEYVFVVAHELGNPIFALGGYLDMVAKSKLDQNTEEFVNTAREINRQLASMVTDLIETARSESGQLTFPLEETDLAATVKRVIENLREKAKSKKVEITFKEDKLPMVMSNDKKLYEVVLNLVDNAIKYSKNGGGKVTISCVINRKDLKISVEDNGLGMSKEEQRKLFEKFYRVKNDKTASIEGTGLGLFIVKTILEKMNSSIVVESKENVGTKFTFNLALADRDNSQKKEEKLKELA